jgi:hypothetical protein
LHIKVLRSQKKPAVQSASTKQAPLDAGMQTPPPLHSPD